MVTLLSPDPGKPVHPHAESMLPAIGGFPPSDRPLFLAGYHELCRIDLNGRKALEICGGAGKLAAHLAEGFAGAEIIGLDLYAAAGPEVEERLERLPNLSYVAGDAFDLSAYAPESFDLVWGQAALHHPVLRPRLIARRHQRRAVCHLPRPRPRRDERVERSIEPEGIVKTPLRIDLHDDFARRYRGEHFLVGHRLYSRYLRFFLRR